MNTITTNYTTTQRTTPTNNTTEQKNALELQTLRNRLGMDSSTSSLAPDETVLSYPNAAGYLAYLESETEDAKKEREYQAYQTARWVRDFDRLSKNAMMPLYVKKSFTDKCLTIGVSPSMDIMMVHRLIRSSWGIPEDQQRLVHNGKQLDYHRTIEDQGIQPEDEIFLVVRLRGGGYPDAALEKWLSARERRAVREVFGQVQEYDVIPEDASLHRELYPKMKTYHLTLNEPYSPRILDAIARYTGNEEFARFNCLLNLLNRVADKNLFRDLMRVCLGSQGNLPDRVFRCCNMNSREMGFYSQNVGKKVILKGFLSTSIEKKKNFGDTVIEIKLIKGQRHGAFFIGSLSQYPKEDEVLLCAYSTYLVKKCKSNYILLDYYDYYEFNN